MSVICQCASCKAKYQLGDQFAGRKIKCPKCSAVVQVPEAAEATAPEALEPATKSPSKVKIAATAAKANSAGAAPRAVKSESLQRPAKAPRSIEGSEEAFAESEMAFSRSDDDSLDFLQDNSSPKNRPSERSGVHQSAMHDSSVLSGDVFHRSGIASRSSHVASRSSKLGASHLRKKKRKSAPGLMIAGIVAGCVALAGAIGGGIYWNLQHKTEAVAAVDNGKNLAAPVDDPKVPKLTFKFNWPESERSGATLTINGDAKVIPATGDVEYKLPVGEEYRFVLTRQGYKPIEFSRHLAESDSYIVTQWEAESHGIAWEQDLDEAKKAALEQHKDVLIVFDASDASASSAASSRFQEAIALRSEFTDEANKEYICVYIDNPVKDEAKGKVKNLARNKKTTEDFKISVFPTVVAADPRGRPFGVMEGYTINGVVAFVPLMEKWKEDRKELFRLLERSETSNDSSLIRKTRDFLELNGLDRFYSGTMRRLAGKLPKGDANEVTEQEAELWMQKFRQAQSSPDNVKKDIEDFDQWKKKHTFKKHADVGAALHAYAALLLLNLGEKEEAKKKCDEGFAFQPKNGQIRNMLTMIQQALSGKPGEMVPLPRGSGSGFCIADGNYIMTNHHVIDGNKKIMVHLNGNEEQYPAHLVADDEEGDMAVLKVDLPADKKLTPIPFVATDVGIGDQVCAFGWPGLLSDNPTSTLTNGLISNIDNTNGDLVTNCKVDHGNSGGPLCSVTGLAIAGMVSRGTAVVGELHESYGLAIPASLMKKFLKEKLPRDVLRKIPRPTNTTGATLPEAVKRMQMSVVYVENYQ